MKILPLSIRCQHEGHSDLNDQIGCLLRLKLPLAKFVENDKEHLQIGEVAYDILNTIHKGNYGELALVSGEGSRETLYWKYSPMKKQLLFKEAILQMLAHGALSLHGLTWAVPEVKMIFEHPLHGVGFFMSHPKDADIFANYIQKHINWTRACEENDRILVEILAQIAIYLCILEDTLQMNHRDLKSTNVVLIEKARTPFTLGYHRKGKRITMNTHLRAILIDFGFACIKYKEDIVAAGNYLPTFDGCPKDGRDFFLLLAHLWNVELLRKCMTTKLQLWFRERLTTAKLSWTDYLIRMKDNSLRSVYLYTASSDFSASQCSAGIVLETLSSSFPAIIQML